MVPDAVPEFKTNPVPAVEATKFPLVAMIFPRVEVIVVPAIIEVPALTWPAVATIFPVVEVIPVPAVIVVPADIEPRVALIFPAEATILPVVEVMPVPAVTVVVATIAVPEVIVVVEAIDPGAMNAAGIERVTVDPEAAVVI